MTSPSALPSPTVSDKIPALLFCALLAGLAGCGGGVPILMYHSVAATGDPLSVTPEQLDAHLAYLESAGFTTVSLSQVLDHEEGKGSLPSHPIVLTFDDGYEDAYSAALPLLKKRGQTATFFVVSGFMGRDHQHRVVDRASGKPYLTWDETRALRDAGMEIGSHTVNHGKLTELHPDAVRIQLEHSKRDLEAKLGQKVSVFAYPFTAHRFGVRKAVLAAGYRGAVVGARGGLDRYELQRFTVHRFLGVEDLRAMLTENWATGFTTGGG